MEMREEQRKRRKFKEIIKEMKAEQKVFKNKTKLEKVYNELKDIYTTNTDETAFRHYYSDIFSVLSELKNDGFELDIIGENLKMVYEYCEKMGDRELVKNVRKFLDHTNLEISRINYINAIEQRMNITDESIGNRIIDINTQVDDAAKGVDELKEKVHSSYSDFVSILGIFSAIVLVFFGGTSIFGNVISSMQETDIEKTILICSITGLVVFDIIFMFIYFLAKLLNRNIAATTEWVSYEPIFVRFSKRYPIVFWFNMILGIVLIISLLYLICINGMEISVHGITVRRLVEDWIYTNRKISKLLVLQTGINFVFVLAYIVAKILDKNIGTVISLRYVRWLFWIQEGEKFVVQIGEKKKMFKNREQAEKYVERRWKLGKSVAYICNFFKRLLFRFPYMTIINIALIIAMILNK